jgi:hypothetical protein
MPALSRIVQNSKRHDFSWVIVYGLCYLNPISYLGVAAKDLEMLCLTRQGQGFRVVA